LLDCKFLNHNILKSGPYFRDDTTHSYYKNQLVFVHGSNHC